MLFCSEEFIFIFLPIFLLIYYLVPGRVRNLMLLFGSLWFYFTGEKTWFFLILVSLLLHYLMTTWMRGKPQNVRRLILAGMLVYDFATLFFFKYVNFIFPEWKVTLPLGISFYTFQIAAYAIDVYRRPEEYTGNFVTLGAYLTMFPQLIAGPIVLFSDVKKQLKSRNLRMDNLEEGLKVFTLGLSYKMLIANILGNLWHEIQVVGVDSISGPMAWMGALAFSLQLYFDFNGYSLMAIGLGNMLGFRIPRNFRQPYLAVSVTDFWRRWHITLSTWFREYLYIPLGGSRQGTARTIINLLVVWAFTGMWHGAGWNFLLWGLYYFVFLVLEKFLLKDFSDRHRTLSRIYTLLVVMVGWVIFNITSLGDIGTYLKKMFLWMPGWNSNPHVTLDALRRYGIFFVIAIICSTCLVENIYRKYKNRFWLKLVLLVLFWICVYRMATAASNPFLYFRF